MINCFQTKLIGATKDLKYRSDSNAPSNERDLFNIGELVVWNGLSENTIWNSAELNCLFRAFHDQGHIETRLNFSIDQEIELGRIQASRFDGLFSDLIYLEISGQAIEYKKTGEFIENQKQWTIDQLRGLT